MSIDQCPYHPACGDRPVVSPIERTSIGPTCTITFGPGQSLPAFPGGPRIAVSAIRGSGILTGPGGDARALTAGGFVQLDAADAWGAIAGPEGLETIVVMVESCCRTC